MKTGEKLMFAFAVLIGIAAITKGIMQIASDKPGKPKNYYEWTQAGREGLLVYRRLGCHNCHRAMGAGEIGVAPVLDGEGTRRTEAWILAYLTNPGSRVNGSAHDNGFAPVFSNLSTRDRKRLAAFLYGLKANPGSPNYPVPPQALKVRGKIK